MKVAAHVCGTASVIISSLYWACITLSPRYWPVACPWRHSEAAFFRLMFIGIALGLFAAWKGSRWWITSAIFALVTFFVAGSTV
jgi:hypothetical protein